jgi:hypothetical protein
MPLFDLFNTTAYSLKFMLLFSTQLSSHFHEYHFSLRFFVLSSKSWGRWRMEALNEWNIFMVYVSMKILLHVGRQQLPFNCGYKFHSLIIHHIASRMVSIGENFPQHRLSTFNLLLRECFSLGLFSGKISFFR